MKVVFTHTDFRIYWPSRLKALTDFFQNKGINLFIIEIANEGSHYHFAKNASAISINWYCLFPDKKIEEIPISQSNKALRNKLDELQPDIVFASAIAFPSGAGAVRWANDNKKKCVIFDDARLEDVPRNWAVNFIKKKIYFLVDAILCPSSEWNNTYKYFGFEEKQIFYGIDVVDNSFWVKNEETHNLNIPGKYFLSIGRQIPKKNFIFLLEAYQKYFQTTKVPLHLVLVGNGPDHEQLRSVVLENSLENYVHFLSFLSQEELRPLYHGASWFILASRWSETWGLVVNEAMASSLPLIISTQVGCASTLVINGKNGFTFSIENDIDLVKLLIKSGSLSEDERIEMGFKSLEIISEWGLDRFCQGVCEAANFAWTSEKKHYNILSKLIIKFWKGRYCPV